MADQLKPTITPEQAAALVRSTVQGVILFGGVGAAGGALLSESGRRARGALLGAAIALAVPVGLGGLIALTLRGFTIAPPASSGGA